MAVLIDAFLDRVKRRVTVPSNQVLLQNTDILQMADSVLREQVVPLILSVNQNYFVYHTEVPVVDGQDVYPIPDRAIGRGLRNIKLQNGSDTSILDMSLIALEDAHLFNYSGYPISFYFRGDKLILVPVPIGSAFTLLLDYDLQHSSLVTSSEAAKVVSVASNVVTVESVPSGIVTGTQIDFIQGKSGNTILGMDVANTDVTGTQITFALDTDIPSDLVPGDYIAVAKETPVLMIPDDVEPLLQIWTCEQILYAIGDFDGAQLLASRAAKVEMNILKILAPRIEGEPTKIVNRNSLLRGKGFSNRFRVRGGYYG